MIARLFLLLLLLGSCLTQAKTVITYISPDGAKDHRQGYFVALLELAMDRSSTKPNDYQLKPHDVHMSQSRAIQLLRRNKELDVVWSMITEQREAILLPVRIPLLKGLMGYRVLIIRQEDQARFSQVHTVEQLKTFAAGQGHDWPDTKILRANGFNVATTSTYDGLFEMLLARRYDFFPRSIGEVTGELQEYGQSGIMLQPDLVLYYLSPMYFFVAPENHKLADRLEAGLRAAIKDGSFDKAFHNYLFSEQKVARHWLKNKKIFELNNPLLPKKTPVDDKQLWYR